MYLPLTDRLTCPRCGPPFGLILLADRVVERRVINGTLGCPNCRDRFPVREGFGDLRAPPRGELLALATHPSDDPERALRVAALLGIVEGPATVLLAGPVVALAAALAARVPQLEVVALGVALAGEPERPGVSRLVARPGLPFHTGSLRGAVLDGDEAAPLLEEAARVLAPASRLVFLDAPVGVRERLADAGLRLLLEQEDTLLAERHAPREAPPGRSLPVV